MTDYSIVLLPLLQSRQLCGELTELVRSLEESVLTCSRGPSPPLDEGSHRDVTKMASVADGLRTLEDALGKKEYVRAVQMLHSMRWAYTILCVYKYRIR